MRNACRSSVRSRGGAGKTVALLCPTMWDEAELRMYEAGVPLLAGTDTAFSELNVIPGDSLLRELELLQEAGIPAREIIVIATSNAARTLGVEAKTGSIAVGKAAHFLLLRADPDIDIANVRTLQAVYRAWVKLVPRT